MAAGRLRLFYLDESGFSPSLPAGYSWCLPGHRKRVRYEYPQGRRVNALATYEPSVRFLDAVPFERTLTSDDLVTYLRDRLPAADVPRVVVLDNAGIHTSKVVKAARPALAELGVYLYYLPPYSPELNRIEPVFKQVKHHDMPTRSFATRADLRKAVEDGFDAYRRRLAGKGDSEPRLAAYKLCHNLIDYMVSLTRMRKQMTLAARVVNASRMTPRRSYRTRIRRSPLTQLIPNTVDSLP